MIIGIGVDSIEIERVIKACQKEHFVKRIFSKREIEQFDKSKRRAASDFSGKEAVLKTFKTGFLGIDAKDVEILRNEDGAPYVELSGNAKKKADELNIKKIHISITNTKEIVTSFAIAED